MRPVLPILAVFGLHGCSTLECGFGTVERDGACVQAVPSVSCGDGTLQSGTECVATCGDGTVVSEDGLSCVAECTDGSVLNADGTACVAECGDGTVLNGDGTACVADLAEICGEGTFISDSDTCVDWAELLVQDAYSVVDSADSETVQDDPFLFDIEATCVNDLWGGQLCTVDSAPRQLNAPNALTLPPTGETSVLRGAITLLGDVSDDGYDDQDWDVYAFEASAGDRLRITARNTGLPNPFFEVVQYSDIGLGDSLTDAAVHPDLVAHLTTPVWARAQKQTGQLDGPRDILISTDGQYLLRLTDGASSAYDYSYGDSDGDGDNEITFDDLTNPVQTGGPGYEYLVAVENLGPITAADLMGTTDRYLEIGSGSTPITLSGGVNDYGRVHDETVLLETSTGEFGFATVTVPTYASVSTFVGALGQVSGDFAEPFGAIQLTPAGNALIPVPDTGLIVSHDYLSWSSPLDDGYEVTFSEPVRLEPGTPFTGELPDGNLSMLLTRVSAGEVLELSMPTVGADVLPAIVTYVWSDTDGAWLITDCAVDDALAGAALLDVICQYGPSPEPPRTARYYEQDSWVRVDLFDNNAYDGTGTPDQSYELHSQRIVPAMTMVDGLSTITDGDTTGTVTSTTPQYAIIDFELAAADTNVANATVAALDAGTSLDVELIEQFADQTARVDSANAPAGGQYEWTGFLTDSRFFLARITHGSGPLAAADVDISLAAPVPPDISASSAPGFDIDIDGTSDIYWTDNITIGDDCPIDEFYIDVDIEHTYRGDLKIDLVAPGGTTLNLHASSTDANPDVIGTYPNTLIPVDDLAVLGGTSTAGTWTLIVEDTYPEFDGGTWNSWGLDFYCQ